MSLLYGMLLVCWHILGSNLHKLNLVGFFQIKSVKLALLASANQRAIFTVGVFLRILMPQKESNDFNFVFLNPFLNYLN
jgi:hypothetical protein